jgi:hypothetical protein
VLFTAKKSFIQQGQGFVEKLEKKSEERIFWVES